MSLILPNKEILTLQHQPGFPTEDANEGNASLLGHLLASNPGIIGQSEFLKKHQRAFHNIATVSMRAGSANMQTNRSTYEGFTFGFSALEYAIMLLKGQALDTDQAAKQFDRLYPKNPFPVEGNSPLADLILQVHEASAVNTLSEASVFDGDPDADPVSRQTADRFQKILDDDRMLSWAQRNQVWPDRLPNTFQLVTTIAGAQTADLRFTAAALVGAQTATELYDPSIAA